MPKLEITIELETSDRLPLPDEKTRQVVAKAATIRACEMFALLHDYEPRVVETTATAWWENDSHIALAKELGTGEQEKP